MRKQLLIGGILGFLIILCSGCTENGGFGSGNTTTLLLGTWQDQDTSYLTFSFASNGSCLINGNMQGTYELKDKSLTIVYPNSDTSTFNFYMSANGHLLKLTDVVTGYVRLFEKQ